MSRFRKLSHSIWHCQYHIVWVPKYRYRILVGAVREAADGSDSSDMRLCRLRGSGAECAARPRSSCGDDSAEAIGFGIAGSVKGSDVDEDVQAVSATQEEAVLGQSFLGQGLLCGHSGFGCGHDTQVCPLSGGKGEAAGAASTLLRVTVAAQYKALPPLGAGPRPPYGGIDQSRTLWVRIFTFCLIMPIKELTGKVSLV